MVLFLVDKDVRARVLKIGSQLAINMQQELIKFLRANLDVFAWTHVDMCEILHEIACYALSIDPKITPVRKKRRSLGSKRSTAVKEVDKLLVSGFIRNATYSEWVSNPVSVKKVK